MPITDTNVVEGPNVQADGEYRGELEFIFDDGRVIRKSARAPDATAWADLIVDMPAQVQEDIESADAAEASDSVDETAVYKQAGIKRVALAYLRKAYEIGDPYRAYL